MNAHVSLAAQWAAEHHARQIRMGVIPAPVSFPEPALFDPGPPHLTAEEKRAFRMHRARAKCARLHVHTPRRVYVAEVLEFVAAWHCMAVIDIKAHRRRHTCFAIGWGPRRLEGTSFSSAGRGREWWLF